MVEYNQESEELTMNKKTYAQRVQELENEGCTNSEANDIAEGELLNGEIKAGSDAWAKGLINVLRNNPVASRIRQENKLKKKLANQFSI